MDEAASNVARAIAAALDWSSTPDARKAAVAYLESIKSGDVRVLANTSLHLVRKDWSSEIRLHGFKMLQHLVRFRWDEFSITERKDFANMAVNLISEMISPQEEWALKSQTAALIAEVIRREGVTLWQELLPSLVSLSSKGPIEAELVAMMLRWLPEDITVHNEDLEGDRRRELLRGLTESLTEILPLLYTLLEKHYGAALSEYGKEQLVTAKQHAATVTAVLNAINAYAEWAPLPDLTKYGLIHGCGFLLSSREFRLHACEFFKLVSQRKRPVDGTASEFDIAMNNVVQILMNISRDFLNISNSSAAVIDESEFEFVESICESMMALGSSNVHCISRDGTILSQYLQVMLGYFQHFKFALHFQSLLFWLVVMREPLSKQKTATHILGESNVAFASVQAETEKNGVSAFITDDVCAVLLDVSLQRMLKKNVAPGSAPSVDGLELWSDEFDGKSDFSKYRSRLLELIRLVASQKPVVAVSKVSQKIGTVISTSVVVPASVQDTALLESLQLGLETTVNSIFDGSADLNYASEVKIPLHSILEGLLQQLLPLKWTEPELAELLGRFLDALGPYLKHFPDSTAVVVNKLFELLTSLPFTPKDPSSTGARHARLQICTSFIRIAKAADKSLLPHMKSIADTMAYLQGEGRLLRGEHNLLGEAFLVMASSAGIQQHQEVLAWLLEPLSKQWVQLEWQNAYLSDPLGLARMCSESQFMWNIFHTVTFFEKALKRSGNKKASWSTQSHTSASESPTSPHPMSSHLSWMLPPLLRLLRCIHSLWSERVAQALAGELQAAKSMSHVEQASLLGEGNARLLKGQITFADGSQADMSREGESIENDIRNWLKCIRDSGYNVIGLSTTIGDNFFRCIESPLVVLALMENVQSMEFRHIRQLIHSVIIPLVKFCPRDLWEPWLESLLHPLFLHCQQALSCSWASLLREGRAKVPDNFGNHAGLELKVEVMEEKLLRGLTREISSLLSTIASPTLNVGLPSVDQLGHASRMEVSLPKDLNAFASNSLIGFLIGRKHLAFPVLRTSIEVFTWTDGEAVAKIISFCGSLILLAASTNNVELVEFVAKDLFYAIIQGLALESNAIISSDLVGLCREIYVYLLNREPSPRQVLLSLPCITTEDLLAFEDALLKTSSPREQKQHMRSLLQLATGNKLKALAAQKSTNVITNVTARVRSASPAVPGIEDDSVIGLAAIS